jgi:penicillin amidase
MLPLYADRGREVDRGDTPGIRSRWVARGTAVAVLCAMLIVGHSLLDVRRAVRAAYPTSSGRLQVADLGAPVLVLRDLRGVPHIEAASERDAYFGLGFVHAQDRLAQMLWLNRVARGRSAEILGEPGVPADRRARILGLVLRADADARRLPRDLRTLLESYSAGVNARIARIAAGEVEVPRAIEAWGIALDPWTPTDTLALLKLYSWGFGGTLEEIVVMRELIQRFGGFGARRFFPTGVGIDVVRPPSGSSVARDTPDPLRRALRLHGRSIGSSAFVVAARRSSSGSPLLAADSHFEPTAPAHLYEAHFQGGAVNVAGATLPGIPVVWTGFTPGVAWASTQAAAVVSDLFVESLHASDPSRYHDGVRWRQLEQREEIIEIRGGEPLRLEVFETRHGPLVNDLLEEAHEPLALRWIGALRSAGIGGLMAAARARSAGELRVALATHHEPVLVVAYADTGGSAGIQMAGFLPRRSLPSGLVPVPGRDPAYDWTRRISFRDLPRRKMGKRDRWVVASDGDPTYGAGNAEIEFLWRTGSRAARIASLLEEHTRSGPTDVRALLSVQADVLSGGSAELVEAVLALAGDSSSMGREAREVARTLREWDGRSSSQSVGAAVYHVFLDVLLREIFEPEMGHDLLRRYLALGRSDPIHLLHQTVVAAKEGRGEIDGWSDPGLVREAVRSSLRDTWIRMSVEIGVNREKWTWGRLHTLRFAPLWREGWAGQDDDFGPIPYDGDGRSVKVADYQPLESFVTRVVSGYRFIVDTADLDQALTALAPGQSEHPGHPHSTDGLVRWRQERPRLLSTNQLVLEGSTIARLELEPSP